jgi:hypothetical protein
MSKRAQIVQLREVVAKLAEAEYDYSDEVVDILNNKVTDMSKIFREAMQFNRWASERGPHSNIDPRRLAKIRELAAAIQSSAKMCLEELNDFVDVYTKLGS